MPPNLRLYLLSLAHSLLAVTLTLYNFFFPSIIPSLRRQFWVLFAFHKFQLGSKRHFLCLILLLLIQVLIGFRRLPGVCMSKCVVFLSFEM